MDLVALSGDGQLLALSDSAPPRVLRIFAVADPPPLSASDEPTGQASLREMATLPCGAPLAAMVPPGKAVQLPRAPWLYTSGKNFVSRRSTFDGRGSASAGAGAAE